VQGFGFLSARRNADDGRAVKDARTPPELPLKILGYRALLFTHFA
jgi:hypothetical protein